MTLCFDSCLAIKRAENRGKQVKIQRWEGGGGTFKEWNRNMNLVQKGWVTWKRDGRGMGDMEEGWGQGRMLRNKGGESE